MDRQLKVCLLALLAGLSCLAITPYLPFFGPGAVADTTATPITFGATAWYEPSRAGGYVTNGGIATLVNLTPAGSIFDMTNTAGSTSPFTHASALNGLSALDFTGSFLTCASNLVSTGQQELILVVAYTNNSVNSAIISTGVGVEFRHRIKYVSSGGPKNQLTIGAATALVAHPLTNRFHVLHSTWFSNGTTVSFMATNTVKTLPLTTTVSNTVGLHLATDFAAANFNMSLAALVVYTNTTLNDAGRSNINWYLTNRFAIAQP